MFQKGYRARAAAAKERSRHRIVSAEVREQRAALLEQRNAELTATAFVPDDLEVEIEAFEARTLVSEAAAAAEAEANALRIADENAAIEAATAATAEALAAEAQKVEDAKAEADRLAAETAAAEAAVEETAPEDADEAPEETDEDAAEEAATEETDEAPAPRRRRARQS